MEIVKVSWTTYAAIETALGANIMYGVLPNDVSTRGILLTLKDKPATMFLAVDDNETENV